MTTTITTTDPFAKITSRFKLIDIGENWDEELLAHFYDTIMKENFPLEDELDPLEEWIGLVKPDEPKTNPFKPEMHILILLDGNILKAGDPKSRLAACVGGAVYEYYKMSNCGLLSYFVVKKAYNGLGLGNFLMQESFKGCKKIAEKYLTANFRQKLIIERLDSLYNEANKSIKAKKGTTDSVNYIDYVLQFLISVVYSLLTKDQQHNKFFTFLAETNALGVDDGVLDSSQRHALMRKYGLRLIDFDYIQPPLADDQQPCADLLLLALENEDIPTHNGKKYIPTLLMSLFITEFAYSISSCTTVEEFLSLPYYRHVMNDLQTKSDKLFLEEMPWTRRTQWQPEAKPSNETAAHKSKL